MKVNVKLNGIELEGIMNKMIEAKVVMYANAYNTCKEYMNKQGLKLIESNHRQKIMQECVYRGAEMRTYIKMYEEKTGTRVE